MMNTVGNGWVCDLAESVAIESSFSGGKFALSSLLSKVEDPGPIVVDFGGRFSWEGRSLLDSWQKYSVQVDKANGMYLNHFLF
jgi:hypothetical protein